MAQKKNMQLSLFSSPKASEPQAEEKQSEEKHLESSFLSMDADELAGVIQHHDALYESGHPVISDALYDRLRRRLEELNPEHPILNRFFESSSDPEPTLQDRQTGRIGKDGRRKVRHEISMLSLSKAYDAETVAEWAKDIHCDLVGSPKLDGLSCSLLYDSEGNLVLASTRGNGEEGDDITPNVRYIKAIPHKINASNIEVRGEVYMPLSSFKQFEDAAMSPRNLAVGGLKQKDPAETAHYGLSYFAYELFGESYDTEIEKLARLKELGFIAVEHELIPRPVPYSKEQNRTQIHAYFHRMLAERPSWDFDADGIVFKANSVEEQRRQGVTAHHPKHSIAFKFQGEQGETTLRSVDWQVSKTGVITPVANFDMLVLSDAEIQRATLVHAGHVEHFPIFDPEDPESRDKTTHLKLGSRLLVSRRGGVIPCAEMVMSEPEDGVPVEIPQKCPSCGAPTETKYSTKDDIYYLACSDPQNCPSTGQALIENYVKVINCMGFGEKIIESLYDSKLISTPADLYRLNPSDIAMAISNDPAENSKGEIKGILPQKLYQSIQSSKNVSLAVFLESLSIPSLGREMSKLLEKTFKTLDALLAAKIEELAAITSGSIKDITSTCKLIYKQIQNSESIQTNETAEQFLTHLFLKPDNLKTIQIILNQYTSKEAIQNADPVQLEQYMIQEKNIQKLTLADKKYLASVQKGNIKADESFEQYLERLATSEANKKNIQSLAEDFPTYELLKRASLDDISQSIEARRRTTAWNIMKGLKQRSELIRDLRQFVTIQEVETTPVVGGPFENMSFLFTGTLASMKREEAQARVEALGGNAASGVSKNLSVLVATSTSSSKWKKAQDLNAKGANIQLWTEDEFIEALNRAEGRDK